MLLKNNDAQSDSYKTDFVTLCSYSCEFEPYGNSLQVHTLGFANEETLIAMGFSWSNKKQFYWKKY